GLLAPIWGAVPVQGGRITGKVVADIPDQRKALPGVIVTLSGERLGDRILLDHAMSGRFPQLMTLDLLGMKGLKLKFRGKEHKGRAGFTIFNITNHWNPRDVQNNIASGQFETFQQSRSQCATEVRIR